MIETNLPTTLQQYEHPQKYVPRLTFTAEEFEVNCRTVEDAISRLDWPDKPINIRLPERDEIAISSDVWPTTDVKILPQHALVGEDKLRNYGGYIHCGSNAPIQERIDNVRSALGIKVEKYGIGVRKIKRSSTEDEAGAPQYSGISYSKGLDYRGVNIKTPHDADILLALLIALESPEIQDRCKSDGKPIYFTYSAENGHKHIVQVVFDDRLWRVNSDYLVTDSLISAGLLPGVYHPITTSRSNLTYQESDDSYYRQLALATPEYRKYTEDSFRAIVNQVNSAYGVCLDPEKVINAREKGGQQYAEFFRELLEVAQPEIMQLAESSLQTFKTKKAEIERWRAEHPEELQMQKEEVERLTVQKNQIEADYTEKFEAANTDMENLGRKITENEKALKDVRSRSFSLSSNLPGELRRSRIVWERLNRQDVLKNIDKQLAQFEADPNLEADRLAQVEELRHQDRRVYIEQTNLYRELTEKRQAIEALKARRNLEMSFVDQSRSDIAIKSTLLNPEYWQGYIDLLEKNSEPRYVDGMSIVDAKPSLLSKLQRSFDDFSLYLGRSDYREEVLDFIEQNIHPIALLIWHLSDSQIIELTPNQKLICNLFLYYRHEILGEDTSLSALMSGPKDVPGILWEVIRCQQVCEHPQYQAILEYAGIKTDAITDSKAIRDSAHLRGMGIKEVVNDTAAEILNNAGLLACHVNLPTSIKYNLQK